MAGPTGERRQVNSKTAGHVAAPGGCKRKTLTTAIRQRRYPSDRPIAADEAATLDEAVPFASSWTYAADLLLGSGFISPRRFVRVVDELDLRLHDMPDDTRKRVFVMLVEAAHVGISDLQVLVDDVLPWFPSGECGEIRRIAMSDGSGVNTKTFGRWVREHALRARFHRRSREALTDLRPISQLARELLEEITVAR